MKINYYKEIKNRYGNIRRAKGYYLYTEKNIRLLDLFLDNGMSIFGRRANQSPLVLKQFIDRGLFAFLPTQADNNLNKALSILFPSYNFRFYLDYSEGLHFLGLKNNQENIQKNLWRPFLPESDSLAENNAFFIQPPFCTNYKIFALKNSLDNTLDIELSYTLQLPAAEKASLARAFFDLIRKKESEKKAKHFNQNSILSSILPYWTIKGKYLFPSIEENKYKEFFLKALDNHILISPDYYIPSILPELKHYTELLNFLKLKNS